MLRILAAAAALALGAGAVAQTTFPPGPRQVELLAPQLVAFTGSTGNFESLVAGLTTGTPVTLTSFAPDGSIQIVTFAPGQLFSPTDTARLLEAARQNLIVRGIAAPSAEQLAVALLGGALPTPSGSTLLSGVLTGSTAPGAFQLRTELAAGLGIANGTRLTAAELQALRNALTSGTLSPARGRMNAFEANQALQLAANLLALQGIVDPSATELRLALLGGTLTTPGGAAVSLQGVLAAPVRNTSDSAAFGTSRSPPVSTSTSAILGTSNTPAAGVNPALRPPAVIAPSGVRRNGVTVTPRIRGG